MILHHYLKVVERMSFSFFKFWLCHVACRILVPRPGMEPAPLNHWTTAGVGGRPDKSLLIFGKN